MTQKECHIVQDLLPLYAERLVSEDTAAFVENHLTTCKVCQTEYKQLKQDAEIPRPVETAPLHSLKKKLRTKKYTAAVCTAAFLLAVAVSAFAFLTAPDYLPYSAGLLSLTERTGGTVSLSFDSRATGYSCERSIDEATGAPVYFVSAWSTAWDRLFSNRGRQNAILEPGNGTAPVIYYSQNDGAENILLYGEPEEDGGVITLPRFVLGYYLLLAAPAAVCLAAACFLFRKKERLRFWLGRAALLPVCYLMGHLCVKGFTITTYSSQRDFFLILLIALLLYCALLAGVHVFQDRRRLGKRG